MAIDPRSLMLGNYVQDNEGGIVKIKNIGVCSCVVTIEHTRQMRIQHKEILYPIPITEQWLKGFGFVPHDHPINRDGRSGRFIKEVDKCAYTFYLREDLAEDNGNCGILGIFTESYEWTDCDNKTQKEGASIQNFSWSIKYVHHLMNALYCVSGHELKLQNDK